MHVLIIEDEDLAATRLTKLLAEAAPHLTILRVLPSVEASVEFLQTNPTPDLIFMDIELADGQSFEIFEKTPVAAPVIFTTSYDEYAIKAFKVNSIDYLLKPIRQPELVAGLQKYYQHNRPIETPTQQTETIDALVHQLRQQTQTAQYRSRFLVRHLSQWLPVEVSKVAYFHSEARVTLMRTSSGQKFSLDYTLDELETMIDPTQFFRASRQFVVNISAVQQVHPYVNHKLKLILNPSPADEVIVSRERATDFKLWMGK